VRPAAILLDFGGTLDACGVPWKERFAAAFAEAGVAPPVAVFDRAFYDADDALVGAVPRELGFGATVERLARDVAARLGVADDGAVARRVAARFLDDARACLEESAGVLARLSARHRLGVVSNFYGNLDAVLAETGLLPHVTVAVDSAVVGATKPDAAIFRAALGPLGVPAAEALFVGDSARRDMAGAKALGMPHVLLAPEGAAVCCAGDRVIARLAALEEIVS
jgi:HAD superfamily hydrolase (TIGR01549 family)